MHFINASDIIMYVFTKHVWALTLVETKHYSMTLSNSVMCSNLWWNHRLKRAGKWWIHSTWFLLYVLTYEVYGVALLWFQSNTIPTHNEGAIQVYSGVDCCSWCNGCTLHHLCDIKLKWGVREHLTLISRKKRLSDTKGWNLPSMCKWRNCTCECYSLPRTWSVHTGLQLTTWNWKQLYIRILGWVNHNSVPHVSHFNMPMWWLDVNISASF